ncbi:ATP-binding protein [Candidatus Omnitrophota bacterium]
MKLDMMRTAIENDSHLLKEVSNKLINALKAKGVGEEIIFDVHVGFEEALRNAMVHGNKNDPAKKVYIETEIKEDFIVIIVEDEGEGFDLTKLPDPTVGENLLKEGGRGVYLILHLMDEVKYESGGRKVIMVKHFGRKRS